MRLAEAGGMTPEHKAYRGTPDGVPIRPGFALGSWLAFYEHPGSS